MTISSLSLNQWGSYAADSGRLYLGTSTIAQRGYKVGDKVLVGGEYSQPQGTIVGLSDDFPDKAQVRLDHPLGYSTTCWIKSEFLS